MIDKLPWLLYFADILNGIYSILVVIVVVSSISIIAALAMKANIFFCDYEKEYEKDKERYFPTLNKILRISVVAWVIAALLNITIPSKETIYAYAGISIAETVTDNPVVGKIERLVNMKLDEMLKKETKSK